MSPGERMVWAAVFAADWVKQSNPRLLLGNMNGHRNVWLVIDILPAATSQERWRF